MSDPNHDGGREEATVNDHSGSPVGSLASYSSSGSRRQSQRVIELLPDHRRDDAISQNDDWRIGEEFYEEDVIAEDHPLAGEEDADIMADEEDNNQLDDAELARQGFFVPNLEQLSESDSNDDDAEPNYDITLPIGHHYLGSSLQEARGRNVLADSSIVTLPLINLTHIVLLPGQILPISTSIFNPRVHMYLENCISRGTSLIGLMCNPKKNPIGTTAEIRQYTQQGGELRIIMEGRQRFELLSPTFETLIEGLVRLLPEISLGRPYHLTPSRRRFLCNNADTGSRMIVSKQPKWLLKQYEVLYLVEKILEQIQAWCNVDPTSNPNDFSYWVAANVPISNQERLQVLKFSCTEERLRWLKDLLERCGYFGCRYCKNVICHRKDMFLMSCSGPQNSFVNSYGCVHDTLTVRTAQGLVREYSWTSEYSWFPGYEWKPACCENCSHHIGWCYRSLKGGVKPKRFFGLSRANLRLQSSDQERIEIDAFFQLPFSEDE